MRLGHSCTRSVSNQNMTCTHAADRPAFGSRCLSMLISLEALQTEKSRLQRERAEDNVFPSWGSFCGQQTSRPEEKRRTVCSRYRHAHACAQDDIFVDLPLNAFCSWHLLFRKRSRGNLDRHPRSGFLFWCGGLLNSWYRRHAGEWQL